MRLVGYYLQKTPRLLRWARIVRAIVMLGPGRGILLKLCVSLSKSLPQRREVSSSFDNLNARQIVSTLNEYGYAHIGDLPVADQTEILAYCKKHDQTSYWNPHKDCEAMDRVCRNAKLLEIARTYLGAEPKLWLSRLRWTSIPTKAPESRVAADCKSSAAYNFHDFHYDTHDIKALTIFIYLTEVNLGSGPHVFITGTHRGKTIKQLMNIAITDDIAQKLYGEKIHAVLGPSGTVFAIDPSGYHKAATCRSTNRLLASFDYVIRNKPPAQDYGM